MLQTLCHGTNKLTRPVKLFWSNQTSINSQRSIRHFSSARDHGPPPLAFAFDIDGVLLRSSTPIPGAADSLSLLQRHRIPFILLTNGGGKSEESRVADINKKLKLAQPLETAQIVQSHTPIKDYANGKKKENYKDACVLVCGGDGDACRVVAEGYGYTNVITPGDIYAAYPEIMPFSRNFADYYSNFARPLPRPINPEDLDNSLKVDAVFVFNDPRDWALEVQLVLDLLLSKDGVLGTYSDKNGKVDLPNRGYQQDGQPRLIFTNPDLLWASAYPLSRLGQGGYRAALEGVWKAVTDGAQLEKSLIGKPHHETYIYAENIMLDYRKALWDLTEAQAREGLQNVYMIGDNPESDIKGANDYQSQVGAEWKSVLVKTGVFKSRPGEKPSQEAKVIVSDVSEGVKWGLRDAGFDLDDSRIGDSSYIN